VFLYLALQKRSNITTFFAVELIRNHCSLLSYQHTVPDSHVHLPELQRNLTHKFVNSSFTIYQHLLDKLEILRWLFKNSSLAF
jgi:hypothetical protein